MRREAPAEKQDAQGPDTAVLSGECVSDAGDEEETRGHQEIEATAYRNECHGSHYRSNGQPLMPKVNSIDELQDVLKGWFRKPGETDDEWRERINSGNYEISIPLFGVPKLMREQEERLRFDGAKPVEKIEPTPPKKCKCPRNGFADPDCPKHGDID